MCVLVERCVLCFWVGGRLDDLLVIEVLSILFLSLSSSTQKLTTVSSWVIKEIKEQQVDLTKYGGMFYRRLHRTVQYHGIQCYCVVFSCA